MDYMTLMGAEQVQRAGSAIRGAANTIQQASNSMHDAADRQQRFMEDWLSRLECVLDGFIEKLEKIKEG